MQDLLDDLIELKKEIIVKKLNADSEKEIEIYSEISDKLMDIIHEHKEFIVPF